MKFAVLAWGSLIWDRRELAIADAFKANGPRLPIEFCRVSGDGRLTLVIEEAFGTSCQTYFAESANRDLDAAIENLCVREGTPSAKGVGFVDVASNKQSDRANARHPEAVAAIRTWTQANGFDAAIWMALASNFDGADKAGEPFSVEAAIRYLERLNEARLGAVLGYISSAPPEVQTPV